MGGLGEFVRAARRREGMSQAHLAADMYHSLSWLRRIERGGGTISDADARTLVEALRLSRWEVRYLYLMMGAPPPPSEPLDDSAMVAYVDALDPHPAAWVSADGGNHANASFHRLIPEVVSAAYIGSWFFSESARDRVANWEEVADWWITDIRFRMASNREFFDGVLDRLVESSPMFKQRWNAGIIPGNPEPPVWVLRDSSGETVRVQMRVWWQVHRRGLLLQGVVDPSFIHRQ